MKRTRRYAGTLGVLFFSLALAACGGGGGGGGGGDGGPKAGEISLKATALKNQQAVAAAPKALDRMWAFLSAKEAVAQAGCDDNKKFTLQGGTETVCLTKTYVVFDEIELEQEPEPSTGGDEIELGPFVVDLLGVPDDGIPGSITIAVPDASFNKIKFKVDDLDDDDDDGLNSDDSGTDDDLPQNVSAQVAADAGLVKKSLVIQGTASDGTSFTFSSDIEGEIEIPFSAAVLDQSTLITFFDLTAAFSALPSSAIASSMDGSMEDKNCSDTLDDSEKLACAIVKDINLFDDSDDDGLGDDSERRGSNDDPTTGFDDSGSRD